MWALTRIGPSPSWMDLPGEAELEIIGRGPSATVAILAGCAQARSISSCRRTMFEARFM
jgi:hypothetical protein